MAGADYALCARCGRKAYYDADTDYGRAATKALCELCVVQGHRLVVAGPDEVPC